MRVRQAVISVFAATNDFGEYTNAPIREILFRQAYHRQGLAYEFRFSKAFATPFGQCDLTIHNPSANLADAFAFDSISYKQRPRVEIRAGYAAPYDGDIEALKNALPMVYAGFPYYVYDQKIVGGRVLTVQLSDASTGMLFGPNTRISEQYRAGQPLIEVLKDLLGRIPGLQYDISELEADKRVSAVTLPADVMYTALPILSTVIPNLGREFGFAFSLDGQGKYVFRATAAIADSKTPTVISATTGMIEHPARVNWTHWNVKTLFGLPRVLYPGEWVRIESEYLDRSRSAETKSLTGMVVNADYEFSDASATIGYVVAMDGSPISTQPVITNI